MRIQSGQSARNFKTEDIFGNDVKLEDYKGKKLMLSFYRYASCPFCNLRIHQLMQHRAYFEQKGLNFIAFFQSPKESLLQYIGNREIPFPIIADPGHNFYRRYGIESSWSGFFKSAIKLPALTSAARLGYLPGKMEGDKATIPADFLIGPDLIVRTAYYGRDIGDHLPITEIKAWLETLLTLE